MKKNGFIALLGILVLLLAFLAGCSANAAEYPPVQMEKAAPQQPEATEVMAVNIVATEPPAPPVTEPPATEPPVTEPPVTEPPAVKQLTADEAKAIALKHAGFAEDQVTRLRSEYEVDDGIPEYEVDFRKGDYEYDYTIHAETGEIRRWDKEYDPVKTAPEATQPPATEPPAAKRLTADEAKAIALKHAGFTEKQVTRLRAGFDWDDGVLVYEVDFQEGRWEYEYEIHAETGKIRSYDKDD